MAAPIRDDDPFALLVADHDEFRRLVGPEWASATTGARRAAVIRELVAAIAAHASAEERELHPLYTRKLGAAGDVYFAQSLGADNTMRSLLAALEAYTERHLDSPSGYAEAGHIIEALRDAEARHMADEEQRYFPSLRAALLPAELAALAEVLRAARANAPTHAHPSAPDKPVASRLTHPIAGVVDRTRDAVASALQQPQQLQQPSASDQSH
jgi:hypothetical protein